MAKRGSLSIVELHVEKGLLALAVLFLVFMIGRYLVMEPNRLELAGRTVGPGELDQVLLEEARTLSNAIERAEPQAAAVPNYAQMLRQQFDAGLFATEGNAPALPREMQVAAEFGTPLQKFEDEEEETNIRVVTPLRPLSVVAKTGISLVRREQAVLPLSVDGETSTAAEEGEPTELSWVTVGGYFPVEAQQREMTKHGYASHRAKVHIAGVDVQRQEMRDSGDWSDWVDVPPGQAIPKLDIPRPVFDDKSGEVVNLSELDASFELVRRFDRVLAQPPFYPVDAGDAWDIPPLPGYDEEAEEEEEASPREPKQAEAESPRGGRSGGRAPAPPPTVGRSGGGGRGAPVGPVGGGRGGGGGGGRGAPIGPAQPAPRQVSPQKVQRDLLQEARRAFRAKNYEDARSKASMVADSGDASKSDRASARRLLVEIERITRPKTSGPLVGTSSLVTHPEKRGEVAVWFHDDSVTPGKTYRYRMRVKLWNRYVGKRGALSDPREASRSLLEGDWSVPSDPITVAPRRHFFVRGPSFGEPAAIVEVYTWHKGNWLREDFKVRVGDVIGAWVEMKTGADEQEDKPRKEKVDFSTGAIVLDLRNEEPVMLRRTTGRSGEFAYRESKSLVVVYLDPVDGQVKERVADVDRANPVAKRLRSEWDKFSKSL